MESIYLIYKETIPSDMDIDTNLSIVQHICCYCGDKDGLFPIDNNGTMMCIDCDLSAP